MQPRAPVSILRATPNNARRMASPPGVKANHEGVEQLFAQFSNMRKLKLKRKNKEESLKLAAVEQEAYRWLVAKLQSTAIDSEFCDVKVVVLKEYIRHQVENEARTLAPGTFGRGLDIAELGKVLQNVQQNLHAQLTRS